MSQAIARVRVKDFEQFLAVFTTRGAEKRRQHGCGGVRVFRDVDDGNQVVNVFDWDRAGVAAFMADPEVPEVMREAGLEGPPDFTFVEPVAELDA